ncbi:MAG: dethiobiotin synthase [Alphaproteobacteria bacterium]
MKRFFITASGTEVGKTLVTTTLCWQLRQRGKKVTALKPVVTGFSDTDVQSDPALILHSCGIHPEPAVMKAIAPWRFEAALAPHMAARDESDVPRLAQVVEFCKSHSDIGTHTLLVEGFGGVMAPLNHEHTVRDIITALDWPVLLVGACYVGAINHTLTAYESLRTKNVDIHAIVISESEGSPVSLTATVDTVEQFVASDIPVVKMPRLPENGTKWKQAPLIDWIVDDEREKAII